MPKCAVIPAKVGIHNLRVCFLSRVLRLRWIPAFAGMTTVIVIGNDDWELRQRTAEKKPATDKVADFSFSGHQ